ncbi:class I SAM-dependent methyltransferase [Halomarina ordinaria]|uniref:Class I SAM-dependent methyltransferase n=1 Tax=Halomarina ordinaria TaxID=3033939 RepID=A0ABD5UC80_9EURY|nr:class I SAM-dependent methyltransferase [Halomarina sp. PSRA2]
MDDQRDRVRRGYDALAEAYAAARSGDGDGVALLSDLAANLPADARVLDAGCGQGAPVLTRLDERFDPVGLDVSRAQLTLAREACDAALLAGDMTALPFVDDSFDGVTAYHSLIHVPTDEHPTALAEFARVLRPGGSLLLSTGMGAWTGRNRDWLDTGVAMEWSFPDLETTKATLRDVGFDPVAEWYVEDRLGEDEDDGDEGATTDESVDPWVFVLARLD